MTTAILKGDLAQGIVLVGVLTANAPHPQQSFIAQDNFAGVARTPVSIYRLAQNLGLPYETTRRHVLRLAEKGFCERDEAGAFVPTAVLGGLQLKDLASKFAIRSAELHQAYLDTGAPVPLTSPRQAEIQGERVSGLAASYFLRGVQIATTSLGVGPIHAMIHFAIMRSNLAHLEGAQTPQFGAPDKVMPDTERRPVSVYAIARELSLPYETARRHVGVMVRRDLVVRNAEGGLIVPAAQLQTLTMVNCVKDTVQATFDFLGAAFPAPAH